MKKTLILILCLFLCTVSFARKRVKVACVGVECRRDSAGLQRNGGKEDECGGEKNAGGVEKLF
jgi:hypothetical protein